MTSRSHRTLSAISLVSLLFVFAVPALHPATGQQKQSTQQRERRVETAPVSTTPPKPERQSVQGTSADTGQSTAPALTLDELRARIRQVIERPELAPALVGVKIISLDTNKLVYEHN